MIGGLIAGALGGAGQAMANIGLEQQKQNQRVETMNIEQQLAIERDAAIQRNRIAGEKELVMFNTDGEGGQAKQRYDARTRRDAADVAVDQNRRTTSDTIAANEDALRRFGTDKTLQQGVRAKAQAGHIESAGSAASAALAYEQLGQLRTVNQAVKALADAQASGADQATIDALQARVDVLRGGKSGNMSDIASMSNSLMAQATKLQELGQEEEAAALRAEAAALRRGVGQKRGIQAPGEAPRAGAPYKDGAELVGPDGKLYVVRNGKPVLLGK